MWPGRESNCRHEDFLVAGIFGLVTYIAVDGVAALLKVEFGGERRNRAIRCRIVSLSRSSMQASVSMA